MAVNTPLSYRNLFIYQVYLRNHNKTGTFIELIQDLDRIKSLGVDVVYLIPIHPVGQKNKKGELGSIYSISDYREINPEYGTLEDFQLLIKEVHQRNMKIMIDVVYNHTSHESRLLKEHPEWFFYRNGKNANKVGDWWDIIDLDFTSDKGLWIELIDTLKYYASMGVDGYRCDVAPLIPIEFWSEAKDQVNEINPDFFWLSESVHPGFIKFIRDLGFTAHSDSEVYQVFDILYDYDIHDEYMNYLTGKGTLKEYIQCLKRQETIYPANYVKLRNLENHDQPRIASLAKSHDHLVQLTAFLFFLKGATMIYAGQEALATKQPSLFDIDKVDWSNYDKNNINELVRLLANMKKDDIMANGVYNFVDVNVDDLVVLKYENKSKVRYGIFNLGLQNTILTIDIPNGEYLNFVNGNSVFVEQGKIILNNNPLIFDVLK